MQVILLEDIRNLGKIGEVVNVRDGYGRNFLLKSGKALRADKENIDLVKKKKEEINKKNVEIKKTAKKILEKIKPVEGRLQKIGNIRNNSKVILDYAHTPEALKLSLLNLKEQFPSSKINLVLRIW